jgi:hypothetical protein
MVLTRSMIKELGLSPVKPTVYRKQVEKLKEVAKIEKEEVETLEETETLEEVEILENKFDLLEKYPSFPEYSMLSWQYYALFTTAFMLCVWQKSALGLVGASLLSQVVYSILTKKKN